MAKKTDKQTEKVEREYVIPLRSKYQNVPRYKKTPKAIKSIKEFLVRHMRIRDRDLNKIKVDKYVNEYMWARGIKNPPHKVKVKVVKEGENVIVTLVDYPDKLKFKKAREDKKSTAAKKVAEKKKKEKPAEQPKEESKESKEDKKETEEKQKAVVEAGEKAQEQKHKEEKHTTKVEKDKSTKAMDKTKSNY